MTVNIMGLRKWSVAIFFGLLAFIAALVGKLSTELAGLLGSIATGYFAVAGYTTGKGKEPRP